MLTDILRDAIPHSIDDVIGTMERIDERLPDSDGLKWFNRLYLRVTTNVRSAVATTSFIDPRFIATLDLAFATLYFDAVRAGDRNPDAAPPAWRPLFQARQANGIARIQFALAGMNAHINRDLPEGIVQTFRSLGGDPLSAMAQRQDFDSINAVLRQVQEQVKSDFTVGAIGVIDVAGGRVDDTIATWDVEAARATAWTNAQVLWALAPIPHLRAQFFDRLDRFTGFAGRGLLVPAGLTTP